MAGYRDVESWSTPPGSRLRMPWRRSVTRISWDDSFTYAKIERPSLVSATQVLPEEASKAACAADSKEEATAALEVLVALAADRFMLPMSVLFPFPCSRVEYTDRAV